MNDNGNNNHHNTNNSNHNNYYYDNNNNDDEDNDDDNKRQQQIPRKRYRTGVPQFKVIIIMAPYHISSLNCWYKDIRQRPKIFEYLNTIVF